MESGGAIGVGIALGAEDIVFEVVGIVFVCWGGTELTIMGECGIRGGAIACGAWEGIDRAAAVAAAAVATDAAAVILDIMELC